MSNNKIVHTVLGVGYTAAVVHPPYRCQIDEQIDTNMVAKISNNSKELNKEANKNKIIKSLKTDKDINNYFILSEDTVCKCITNNDILNEGHKWNKHYPLDDYYDSGIFIKKKPDEINNNKIFNQHVENGGELVDLAITTNSRMISLYQLKMPHGGDGLLDYLDKKTKISIKVILKLFLNLFEGISILISNNMIHQDINTNNILVDKNNVARFIDFEYLVSFGDEIVNPKILNKTKSNKRLTPDRYDIYQLGIIMKYINKKYLDVSSKYSEPSLSSTGRSSSSSSKRYSAELSTSLIKGYDKLCKDILLSKLSIGEIIIQIKRLLTLKEFS
jgi:serine/threonine protein kinase